MLFEFNAHSGLLLPFVLTGGVAAAWLLGRALVRRTAPDALLALLLLLPTLSVSRLMLCYAGWATQPGYAAWLRYVPWHLGLAVGPAYYLYLRSLTNQAFRWRAQWWHLVPGLLQVLLSGAAALADQLLPPGPGLATSAAGEYAPGAALLGALNRPQDLLGYALLLGYSLRVLADYRRYRRYLDDNFSNQERLRFDGLRQLLGLQLLGLTLSLVFTGLDMAVGFSDEVGWLAFALRGCLIYGLLVVGLESNYAASTNPLRFQAEPNDIDPASVPWPAPVEAMAPARQPIAAETPLANPANAPAPPATSAAPALAEPPALLPELLPWRTKLLHLMDAQQLWLEPDLNLTELARRVGIHSVLLSKVINTGCGQNFNDFVNAYRVAEARRKLTDPRFAHYSLLGIALECGFNSQSTFTRAFKKLTGELPSAAMRVKL